MAYRVIVLAEVEKQLLSIDKPVRDRLRKAIDMLGENPRRSGVIALQGRPGYRARVGDYRILFTVHDDVIEVHVFRVAHRREVYER